MAEYRVNANPARFSITIPEAVGTAKPPAKPPRPPFIDRNLKAGKFVLKIVKWLGQIGSAIGGWKTLLELFDLKRQPAQAPQL